MSKKKHKAALYPREAKLEHVLQHHGVSRWDYVLFGDGSGSTWKRRAGWGTVMIAKATRRREVYCGSANRGSVNFAEIMAYLQPLEALASAVGNARANGAAYNPVYVHIFTDSQYCRDSGMMSGQKKKNAGLWGTFDVFARMGIILKWHWIRRESLELNQFCDKLSRMARITIEKHNPRVLLRASEPGEQRTVYELNPDAE